MYVKSFEYDNMGIYVKRENVLIVDILLRIILRKELVVK